MKIPRRRFLSLAGAGAVFPVLAKAAAPPPYPTRPIRLVVGFPPGGPNDILAHLMGQWLTERLRQPINVDNRTGASGNLATEIVAHSPADGYTLLLVGPANAINASLYDKLNFDFLHDIAPVAGITREPLVMLIHPSIPARTVADFIVYAKAASNKIKTASAGYGSSPHMSALLFNILTGIDLDIVHYAGGGPALKDMIAGQAQLMFEPISASIAPIRAGKLRALAVTTTGRSLALPELPTMGDFVPDYEASAVTGIGVPTNAPVEIIDRLNSEINAAFTDPTMKARLDDTGGMVLAGPPADFGRLMAEETKKWGGVIKAAGAKL